MLFKDDLFVFICAAMSAISAHTRHVNNVDVSCWLNKSCDCVQQRCKLFQKNNLTMATSNELQSFVQKFKQLRVESRAGKAFVELRLELGEEPGPTSVISKSRNSNKNQFFSVKLHHLPSVLWVKSTCQISCLKYTSFWRVTILGLVGDHPKDGRWQFLTVFTWS